MVSGFASVAKISIMQFTSDIVLLTAAHFHYSAFLLPLSAGLIGRKREKSSKVYAAIMFIIVISPMTVAIGITYSRVFEFLQCAYIYVRFMVIAFTFGKRNLMLSAQKSF